MQVNIAGRESLREECRRAGLANVPYFQFLLNGDVIDGMTANVHTIGKLRTALNTHLRYMRGEACLPCWHLQDVQTT